MKSPAVSLLALVIGLGLGVLTAATSHPVLVALAAGAQPVGSLWINGIRMTVIPLVMSLVITGVASDTDLRRLGRLGARVVPVFLALLLAGGVFAAVLGYPLIGRLTIPPEVAARVRAGLATATGAAAAMPSLTQRIIDMVPFNPVKAAVDGAMLPLIVFAIAMGAALASLDPSRRDPVVRLFRGIGDAMLVLVQWVLALAPIGILALTFSLGARMGAESAGALLYYVVVLSGVMLAYMGVLYPIAVVFGGVSIRDFAAAAAPAQAVAISSRSSLAALPSLITGARERLRLPAVACDFLLPLSVAVFRCNVSLAWVVGILFLGQLYGVPIDLTAMATVVVTSSLISFSVPGLPSASLFLLAPFLTSLGIPAEGAGILIALDLVPDMFKTSVNVTSQLAATAIALRRTAPPATAAG
ncbi:MAG: dicarboxylate/amino acid:cation symporter [Gemmatimonadaceae bacterium]